MTVNIRTEANNSSTPSTRWRRRLGWAVLSMTILATVIAVRHYQGAPPANAEAPGQRSSLNRVARPNAKTNQSPVRRISTINRKMPDPVAVVNGQDIRLRDLQTAAVKRYGKEVLESIVNKHLIAHHCKKRGIVISAQDIEAEIANMAARFKLPKAQFLSMLQQERGINLQEYREDTVWAMLALRKLAADQLTVTKEDLKKAFETQYGAQVRARLIVVATKEKGERLRAQLLKDPSQFARIAIDNSIDVHSASLGGLIQPIRAHVGDPAIEQVVFSMTKGQISPVIPVGNQFAILKCEGIIPGRKITMASVQKELVEQIREAKLRDVAGSLFKKLQQTATVKNVYNDPNMKKMMPGVVATINGEKVTYQQLADACVKRHGEEVLQVEISHLLLRQALQSTGQTITNADLQKEIEHAAVLSAVTDKNGKADLKQWMKMATEERGISQELYIQDSVWPSAALKKLAAGQVKITQEDLQKAYEANYGERVRVRAIVMNNQRRAQQVWDMARRNPTLENFATLAAEYSIEPASSSLRGEVPPIRRFGGSPQLENVAFNLKPNQVSGIIQIGEQSIILFCEGRTKPVSVKMAEVQDVLYKDIYEKKMRQAMGTKFEMLQARARIDNYLDGTSKAPKRTAQDPRAARPNRPALPRTAATPRRDTAVRPASANRTQPRR